MADALGRSLAFHLTVGEAANCKAYDALIGLPERAPDALLADKGYDADAIRTDLAATVSSAWSTSPPPDTGSNLSTPPNWKRVGTEEV